MAHFIELTQRMYHADSRKIKAAVEQICFYYDHRIVFNSRAIDVDESYEEITYLINSAMKE